MAEGGGVAARQRRPAGGPAVARDRVCNSARPPWSVVLRALREARGVTQAGWGALLGYSTMTVRRWEQGTAAPTAEAEAAIIRLAQERGLFRPDAQGPLRGLPLTPDGLADLLAAARLELSTRPISAPAPGAPAVHTATAPSSGTVTLLLTDVEGSTHLLRALGDDRYAAVLAAHRDLLRAAFRAHGGTEVDTQGDAFFYVFARAQDAIAGVVVGQRALAAHPWPDGAAVRVRMGLHTGEPVRTAEGYAGLDLHRTARIKDAGHGGQVLLSETTAAHARHLLADDVHLRDLGDHRLKDLGEPEHLFQLIISGLPAHFPPLRSLDADSSTPPVQATPLIGRGREMAALRTRLDAAQAGRGGIALLAGEPGIGKTRLAEELVAEAASRGARAVWGRCHEGSGAPAYWPWIQVIRTYAQSHDEEALRAAMGPGAADIAQVVPEVQDWLRELPTPPALEPEQARFRLFDSVTTFLRNAATVRPLLLVLDDLHWADEPSLLLLQFLAREVRGARILVAGTYRDAEVEPGRPLSRTLAGLAHAQGGERLLLRGLAESEVAALIESLAGVVPPAGLVTAVYRETEGNPFFIAEVVRLLAADGRLEQPALEATWQISVPQSVREVIGQRLDRLSEACNRVLTSAAVIGREFSLAALERVVERQPSVLDDDRSGTARDRLWEVLEEAEAGHVIAPVPGAIGRYGFAHALIRETLYEGLSSTRRARMHRQVGEVLESLWAADPEPHLAELAHHFTEAAPAGDVERALAYERRSGDRALALFAYEEAAAHYERALQVLDLDQSMGEARRGELLLALGDAQVGTGAMAQARDSYQRAAAVARRLGAGELLARAALGITGWLRQVLTTDERLIRLLREALNALGEDDSPLCARVMARLATEYQVSHDASSPGPGDALSQEAVAMARRLGDPGTLAAALSARHFVLAGPDHIEERIALAGEIVPQADAARDRNMMMVGHIWRIMSLLELGEVAALDRDIDAVNRLADELRHPYGHWHAAILRIMRTLLEGRFAEAEGQAQEALALGQRAQAESAIQMFTAQIGIVRREQGRLAEVEPIVRGLAQMNPMVLNYRIVLAYILIEIGREAEARAEFERLAAHGFTDVPRDWTYLQLLTTLAWTCGELRDAPRAAILYDLLRPYAGRGIGLVDLLYFGAAGQHLGLLAATMGRWQEATAHFEDALALNARMGARPWLAHAQHDYAAMLLARHQSERGTWSAEARHLDRAQELVAKALATAAGLGMVRLSERARSLDEQIARAQEAAAAVPHAPKHPGGLTARELEVLRLIAAGHSNAEIADALVLSVHTVERHLTNIYSKIGARGRADAIAYALRGGLTES